MPELYIRKGKGWHRVDDVEDVKVEEGRIALEDGTLINGDLVKFIMKNNRECDGQKAMKKLAEMQEGRIVDFRIKGGSHLELSTMLQDVVAHPERDEIVAVVGRVLGMRKIGAVAS